MSLHRYLCTSATLCFICCHALTIAAAIVLLAWTAGLVLNDRWQWSQWLWWIPSIVPLMAAVVGLLAAVLGSSGRCRVRRAVIWGGTVLMIALVLVSVENRLHLRSPAEEHRAVHILHWNVSQDEPLDRSVAAQRAFAIRADITILTDAYMIPWHAQAKEVLGGGVHVISSFPFACVSRFPLLEVRQVVAVDGMYATAIRVAADDSEFGGQLNILAIDLPSDLSKSRMAIAQRMRRLLVEAGNPPEQFDLVVGDFNITRSSASLAHLTADMPHAWSTAGRGWSGTYPRTLPLFHIDHTFINGANVRMMDYELIDFGVCRHRAQRIMIQRP